MTTPPPEWAPQLPGLAIPGWGRSHIERAAQATLANLEAQGLLEPRHALACQVVLELARAVGNGLAAPKVTVATATLSKHLLEAMEALPQPEAPVSDAWADFERQLAEAATQGGAA